MIANRVIIVFALLIVAAAQTKLSDIPVGCSVTPSNPDGCLHSTPVPYYGACARYSSGKCWDFCGTLVERPTTCVKNQPNQFLTFGLRIGCAVQCYGAKLEMEHFARQGINRSELHSLIYVGASKHGRIKARKYVYRFSELKKVDKVCTPRLCIDMNKCSCSSCWSNAASCPDCCRWAGHIYLW